jgi:hypothetical protein
MAASRRRGALSRTPTGRIEVSLRYGEGDRVRRPNRPDVGFCFGSNCAEIRRDTARVRNAVSVLEFSRLQREEFAQRVAVLFAAVGPVFLDRIPKFSQTLIVGVAVLDDNGRDAFGVFQCQVPADGALHNP